MRREVGRGREKREVGREERREKRVRVRVRVKIKRAKKPPKKSGPRVHISPSLTLPKQALRT